MRKMLYGVVAVWLLMGAVFARAQDPLDGAEYVIEVSFSDFALRVLDADGTELYVAPVALPRHTPALPVAGQLVAIQRDPYWYPTEKLRAYILKKEGIDYPAIVPPGPGNPMGKAKLSTVFSTPGAEQLSRIHGTNHPNSIGKRASSGCIRMRNADVVELCDLLEPLFESGAKISVRYVEGFEDELVADSR